MDKNEILKYVDHTLLKVDATWEDIKKIDLEGTGKIKIVDPKIEVKLIDYEKEEEFLKVLKDLQSKLS